MPGFQFYKIKLNRVKMFKKFFKYFNLVLNLLLKPETPAYF